MRSFVDFIKYIIFMYGHWITMIMTLCAGLGGTSLFALGYVILAFWMLWEGNNLYTMHRYTKTLARWNTLAKYTVFIMLCKIFLQLVGCVFIGLIRPKQLCPVQQLFSIFCVNPLSIGELQRFFSELPSDDTEFSDLQSCSKGGDSSEASIGFDAVAFLFIIFQLRILHSWYFQRCMIEFRCEVIQANRGAVLINQLIEKEMREQTEHQNKKLREIKARTAAIRKRYEEQQRRSSGYGAVVFSPQTYGQAKRAGDYYMFEGDPEIDDLIEPVISFVPEVTPGAGDFDKLDPAQLLHTALGKDLDLIKTLDSVEEAEQIKDEKLRMIAAVAPSEKAREIAKLALKLRHQSPPKPETVHHVDEGDYYSIGGPSTSQAEKSEKDEETDTTDGIPIIRFRKKRQQQQQPEDVIEKESTQKEIEEQQQTTTKIDAYSYAKAIISFFQFLWKIMIAFLDWISAFLNRRSREHRYVAYVLNKEKEHLKEMMSNELYDGQISSSDLRERWESHNMHIVSSEEDIKRLENEAHDRWAERNVFARFINAVGNCICAHTDIICYAFAVFVHGKTAGLLTLPLPALVFFWGTLANPRPSKFFWVTMIIWTELVIVIKFAFQFGFWDWNSIAEEAKNSHKIYKLQYIFGVQRVEYFAVTDVALLIALFFHRNHGPQIPHLPIPPALVLGLFLKKSGLSYNLGELSRSRILKEANIECAPISSPISSPWIDPRMIYMLRKLGLWRDANSDRLLAYSPQLLNNSNGKNNLSSTSSSEQSPNKRKGRTQNGSTATETSAITTTSISDDQINLEEIDIESGQKPITTATAEPVAENSKLPSPPSKIVHLSVIGNFIEKLIYPKFRYICDFYPLMFFLDIFCMLIIAFGYSSFGEGGTGDVVSDIKSNRIPITLVVIILVQSLMIVLDRGLYLRKAVVAKLIYHLLTLIIVHVWIFFILPLFTQKRSIYKWSSKIFILYQMHLLFNFCLANKKWLSFSLYWKILLTHSY
uniref:Piezo domain-containing protein n=1 Tax=Meloidogyne incognita TaxID=6306 RepID=A0A914LGH4_MELIC